MVLRTLLKKWKSYNGLFTSEGNYIDTKEVHAFVNGMYFSVDPRYEGLPEKLWERQSPMYNGDVDDEGHYARGGYLFMEHVQLVLFVAMVGVGLLVWTLYPEFVRMLVFLFVNGIGV